MHGVDELPWPNLRGKRCLELGPSPGSLAAELRRRGAAEVVEVDLADATDAPSRLGDEGHPPFDVVVARDLTSTLRDPIPTMVGVRSVAHGLLLSIEPVDLWLSIVARGRPLLRPVGEGTELRLLGNGAAHKQLLAAVGFQVERTSRPFVAEPSGARTGPAGPLAAVDRVVRRRLTGTSEEGVVRRALLARAVLPAFRA